MRKILGEYGTHEIQIVENSKGITVCVWDKSTLSNPIGRFTLQWQTPAASVESAKELAASSIARVTGLERETIWRGIHWLK